MPHRREANGSTRTRNVDGAQSFTRARLVQTKLTHPDAHTPPQTSPCSVQGKPMSAMWTQCLRCCCFLKTHHLASITCLHRARQVVMFLHRDPNVKILRASEAFNPVVTCFKKYHFAKCRAMQNLAGQTVICVGFSALPHTYWKPAPRN